MLKYNVMSLWVFLKAEVAGGAKELGGRKDWSSLSRQRP